MSAEANIPASIVAAIVGIVGAVAVAILAHVFSKRRESFARVAAACSEFRGSVEVSTSKIPPSSKHWDNEVLSGLPEVCSEIGIAAAKLAPFLGRYERERFLGELKALKLHCAEAIPKALSTAEVIYGGGQLVAETAKTTFHNHVRQLLSHAQKT